MVREHNEPDRYRIISFISEQPYPDLDVSGLVISAAPLIDDGSWISDDLVALLAEQGVDGLCLEFPTFTCEVRWSAVAGAAVGADNDDMGHSGLTSRDCLLMEPSMPAVFAAPGNRDRLLHGGRA